MLKTVGRSEIVGQESNVEDKRHSNVLKTSDTSDIVTNENIKQHQQYRQRPWEVW